MLTLENLLAQLSSYADDYPDALVRINGEYVHNLTTMVQNPLLETGKAFGLVERKIDGNRKPVIDLLANDHEAIPLPIVKCK